MTNISYRKDIQEIKAALEQVCQTILSVLSVDVTIVDDEFRRITGTGRYAESIGKRLEGNGVFKTALISLKSQVVENPRENIICIPCTSKESCKEFAQVCCPIIVDGQSVGVLGLAAFSPDQKKRLLKNQSSMLAFIESMAGLLATKVKENSENKKIALMAGELSLLFDAMDNGVLTTDEQGRILRYNRIANEMLHIDDEISKTELMSDSLFLKDLSTDLDDGPVFGKEFTYLEQDQLKRGFYTTKPIKSSTGVKGYLFILTPANEIIKVVEAISGSQMPTSFNEILGTSETINAIKRYALQIATGSSTVLLQGESGTGKELFARAIHNSSPRCGSAFIAINCSAIPESLIESELFGYEEGAFTGARKSGRMGKFELASKGTLFLDEIGDMPLNLQTKLLRVLQENVIERVGGNSLIPVDIRIITATNKDLELMVEEKAFRKDLFYRLNVIPISLPSLRERQSDIELIALNFLEKYNYKLDRRIISIDQTVIRKLKSYIWPGNVRELENTIEYAVNVCTTAIIKLEDLPRKIREFCSEDGEDTSSSLMTFEAIEKKQILRAIKIEGSPEKAAIALGISRATIYRKIKKYHMTN